MPEKDDGLDLDKIMAYCKKIAKEQEIPEMCPNCDQIMGHLRKMLEGQIPIPEGIEYLKAAGAKPLPNHMDYRKAPFPMLAEHFACRVYYDLENGNINSLKWVYAQIREWENLVDMMY